MTYRVNCSLSVSVCAEGAGVARYGELLASSVEQHWLKRRIFLFAVAVRTVLVECTDFPSEDCKIVISSSDCQIIEYYNRIWYRLMHNLLSIALVVSCADSYCRSISS